MTWLQTVSKLEGIANDPSIDAKKRIKALTELFFLYQHDVQHQASVVRSIQDICTDNRFELHKNRLEITDNYVIVDPVETE